MPELTLLGPCVQGAESGPSKACPSCPLWYKYIPVSDQRGPGKKAKHVSTSHGGEGPNAAALRSRSAITQISYLLNGFLRIYGLDGGMSGASGGAYTVSGSSASLSSSPPALFGNHDSQ